MHIDEIITNIINLPIDFIDSAICFRELRINLFFESWCLRVELIDVFIHTIHNLFNLAIDSRFCSS